MRTLKYFFLLVIIGSCFSCKRTLVRLLLGVDLTPKWVSQAEIKRTFDRYDLSQQEIYVLDTFSYRNSVLEWLESEKIILGGKDLAFELDSLRNRQIRKIANDNLQPVQLRFFEASGLPIFKMVNCYVDPPVKMDWNVDGSLDAFPPTNIEELRTTFNDDLQHIIRHVKTLDNKAISMSDLPVADYYAVVFWNSFMIKPSNKLIGEVKDYEAKHKDQNVHVIYVNNHNSILWPQLSQEQQNLVLDGKI